MLVSQLEETQNALTAIIHDREECCSGMTELSTHLSAAETHLMRIRLPPIHYRHRKVGMNSLVPQVVAHLCHEHIHLLLLPPQPSRQQSQAEPFQPVKDIDLVPSPQLFHERVTRPSVRGPHKPPMRDVHEPRFMHPLHVHFAAIRAHGTTELERRFTKKLAPLHQVGAIGGPIRRFDRKAVILKLKPASRLEVAETHCERPIKWPVGQLARPMKKAPAKIALEGSGSAHLNAWRKKFGQSAKQPAIKRAWIKSNG